MSSPVYLDKALEIIDSITTLHPKTPEANKSKSSEPIEPTADKNTLFGDPISLDEPNLVETKPDPVEPKPVEPKPVEPSHSEPNHIETSHSEPNHVEPSHVEPSHVEPNHVEPNHVEPSHVEPSHVEPNHVETKPEEPSHSEPNHVETKPEEPNHVEPERHDTPESSIGTDESVDINKFLEDVSGSRTRSASIVSDGDDVLTRVMRDVENMREDANSQIEFVDHDEIYIPNVDKVEVELPKRARILDTPRSSKWRPSPIPLKKIVNEMESRQLDTITYRVDFDLKRIVDAGVIGRGQDVSIYSCYSLETALNKPVQCTSVSITTPLSAYILIQMFEADRCYIEELTSTMKTGVDRFKSLHQRLKELRQFTMRNLESVYIEDPNRIHARYSKYREQTRELIHKLQTKYVLSECKCDIYKMKEVYEDFIETFNVETRKISAAIKNV